MKRKKKCPARKAVEEEIKKTFPGWGEDVMNGPEECKECGGLMSIGDPDKSVYPVRQDRLCESCFARAKVKQLECELGREIKTSHGLRARIAELEKSEAKRTGQISEALCSRVAELERLLGKIIRLDYLVSQIHMSQRGDQSIVIDDVMTKQVRAALGSDEVGEYSDRGSGQAVNLSGQAPSGGSTPPSPSTRAGCKHGHVEPCTQCIEDGEREQLQRDLAAAREETAREKARNAAYESDTWEEVENILAEATTDDDCLDGRGIQEITRCVVNKVADLRARCELLEEALRFVRPCFDAAIPSTQTRAMQDRIDTALSGK